LEFYSSLLTPIREAHSRRDGNLAVHRAALDMIDELIWGVTTLTNRARWDVRYVSEGAKLIYEELYLAEQGRRLTAAKRKFLPLLRHEHVIGRSELKGVLFADGELALLRAATACVVTKREDERLAPKSLGFGWERYWNAEIRVWDRQIGDWLDLV
jgi:hypothetical protein